MKTETIEHIGAISSKATVAGAMTGFWGWLSASGTLGLLGLLIALGGLAVNWYYKREANRRHTAEHELKMARLRQGARVESDLAKLEADE